MPKITFLTSDGQRSTFEIAAGTTLMQGALQHGIDAIVAECGGNSMCATCHVYIDDAVARELSPMSADEDALLDGAAADREPGSRLSCQIRVTSACEGLLVRLPDRQT